MFFRSLILIIIISPACLQSGDEETDAESHCQSIFDDVKSGKKQEMKSKSSLQEKKLTASVDKEAMWESVYDQIDATLEDDFEGMADSAIDFIEAISEAVPNPGITAVATILAFAWKLYSSKVAEAKKEVDITDAITEALEKQSSVDWQLKLHALKVDIHEVIENSCKYHKDRSTPFSATENYNALNSVKIADFARSLEVTFCKDQEKKDDKKISRCLLLANLYAEFQMLRQMAIACYKLAISIPPEKPTISPPEETTEKKEIDSSQEALEENTNNEMKVELLNQKVERILKKDLIALSFLHKVMNMFPGGHRIHIFAALYSNLNEYKSLNSYMTLFGKKFDKELKPILFTKGLEGRIELDEYSYPKLPLGTNKTHGIFVPQLKPILFTKGLEGRIELDEYSYPKLPLGTNKTHGIFVPHKRAVYFYHMEHYKGTRNGPYYGQAMYEEIRYPGIWASLKVVTSEAVDPRKMVRICGKFDLKGECITVRDGERILENNMGNQYNKGKTGYYSSTWKEVKYICREKNGRSTRCERTEYLPITDYPMNTYNKYLDKFYCSINGSSEWPCFRAVDWTWRVRSMVVPRGLTAYVKQYSKVLNKENLQKMKRDYGPYTGPQVASNLPPFASEMRIVDTDSSKLQIRLCTEPNLKGQCGEETINVRKVDEEGKQTIDLTKGINNIPFHMFKLHEKPWGAMGHSPETTELRSVKIPDGYDIIRYTRKEDKTEILSDTLSGYVKNIHGILDSGRKSFKLEVKKKSETRFKAATVKEKEDTIF